MSRAGHAVAEKGRARLASRIHPDPKAANSSFPHPWTDAGQNATQLILPMQTMYIGQSRWNRRQPLNQVGRGDPIEFKDEIL